MTTTVTINQGDYEDYGYAGKIARLLEIKAKQYQATAQEAAAKAKDLDVRDPRVRIYREISRSNDEASRFFWRRAEELRAGGLSEDTKRQIQKRKKLRDRRIVSGRGAAARLRH